MYKVAIIGHDDLVIRMFRNTDMAEVTVLENPLKEAERPDKYDLVVFTGGSDVTPWLYGEKNTTSHNNLNRDIREVLWFHRFLNTSKVGICRGGQFLFSMSGGIMQQHIEGHGESHKLNFLIWDPMLGNSVTSTHHQHMAKPRGDMSVLAQAPDGKNEIIWCANSRSLCFQPHPEYDDEICRKLFFWYLNKLYKMNFTKPKQAEGLGDLLVAAAPRRARAVHEVPPAHMPVAEFAIVLREEGEE